MIAKCGEVNIWHWAHEAIGDCDSWYEGESDWHRCWKSLLAPDYVEVSLGEHRADILLPNGTIIELQHSAISTQEIEKREVFYGRGRMLWIFDATAMKCRNVTNLRDMESLVYGDARFECWTQKARNGGSYWKFRWKHAKRSLKACRAPVFLDFGDRIFAMRLLDRGGRGWGYLLERQAFIDKHFGTRWDVLQQHGLL